VPYLLNLAGIAVLVIASGDVAAETASLSTILIGMGMLVALVLIMGMIDLLVFSNLDKISKQLDPHRLAVTEAVFGVLLAALAVQLMVDGLAQLGVISAVPH
jgi:small neutral amino acid transporter SnatA (MarC family)